MAVAAHRWTVSWVSLSPRVRWCSGGTGWFARASRRRVSWASMSSSAAATPLTPPSPPTPSLGLMEPISNGVGGDLFAIVYCAKENKLYGLNGSGRSPMGLSYDTDARGGRQAAPQFSPVHRACYPSTYRARWMAGPHVARQVRQAHPRGRSERRDPVRGGRFSRHADHRVLLGT